MKVKVFYAKDHLLEKPIRKWLEEVGEIEVVSIEQSYCNPSVVVTVFYKEVQKSMNAAITTLEVALEQLKTNEPINRAAGN